MFLPWTARGLRYDSREYLASTTMNLDDLPKAAPSSQPGLDPDMPFTEAVQFLAGMGAQAGMGPGVEHGCFNHNGALIEDPGLRFRRQGRNILYYVIRDLFNIRRGQPQHSPGLPLGHVDPVPESPQGNWAILIVHLKCLRRDRTAMFRCA